MVERWWVGFQTPPHNAISAMDIRILNQQKVPENLREQLAVAVRNIQWSYSIFWSISSSDPRVLEWGEGYYNGDIKTRKTVQAVELNVDQMGLQRSEQLKELYESLLVGETNPQSKRPSASLSPEDLSNTEWYYLVCMSFVFNLGQGLPGRTLQNGQPIWLCNAHQADSKVFGRSLLAKSASIQTVVCFPLFGGVIELGVTDQVSEDLSVVQYVQASLLGIDCPVIFHIPNDRINNNPQTPILQGEEVELLESPGNSSNGFRLIQSAKETEFMIKDTDEELIDDEPSKSVHTSMTSSECISQNLMNPESLVYVSMAGTADESCLVRIQPEIQGFCSDDLHYQNVLSTLFKSAHDPILDTSVHNCYSRSDFWTWKKGCLGSRHAPRNGSPQRILKKILFDVPRMHGDSSGELKVDGLTSSHVLAERKRREKVNTKFSALKSLIPSIDKVDKVSILDDTIKYLKDLETRVEELETRRDLDACKTGGTPQDTAERTSDNYGSNKVGSKRKASDAIDCNRKDLENSLVTLRDSSTNTNLSISLMQKDVVVEIRCPWRECLLLKIIDAMGDLRLDTHSVQSSTKDGFLCLNIKAKVKGVGLSVGMIRVALQRILMRSG